MKRAVAKSIYGLKLRAGEKSDGDDEGGRGVEEGVEARGQVGAGSLGQGVGSG